MEFYKKGAEAELTKINYKEKKAISKKRISKGYRNPKLDAEIRKRRTRSESKIIKQLSNVIKVPEIYVVDEANAEIIMEFVKGKMLKEVIEKNPELAKLAGKEIKKIHNVDIIHGDLTTSNVLIDESENESDLCFVDFGLGYFSKRIEDKATDLIVFKKTFNATHSSLKNGWALILEGYQPNKEMVARMNAIEKRARYH